MLSERAVSVEALCDAAQTEVRILREHLQLAYNVLNTVEFRDSPEHQTVLDDGKDVIAGLLAGPTTWDEPLPDTGPKMKVIPDITKPPPKPIIDLAVLMLPAMLDPKSPSGQRAGATILAMDERQRRWMLEAIGLAMLEAVYKKQPSKKPKDPDKLRHRWRPGRP